jgi:hypothetical protein
MKQNTKLVPVEPTPEMVLRGERRSSARGSLTMPTQELRPCPFCGGMYIESDRDGAGCHSCVTCRDCAAWNRRAAAGPACAPAQPAAAVQLPFNGWYCAQCQRGVDASEVTFHEQHTVCGRVITNDMPPAATHPPAGEQTAALQEKRHD